MVTLFRYPRPPLGLDNYELVEAIGNERFILAQQIDRKHIMDYAFFVYDRYRNNWFGPIQMPALLIRPSPKVWLLRFVDTHRFLILLTRFFGNKNIFEVILARLSTSLQEATIITRCRLPGPLSTRLFPLLRATHLLRTAYSDTSCFVYDISEPIPVVLGTFSIEGRALYATQHGEDIFIVCKPIDSQEQVIMKSYNLNDRAISEVSSFDPRLSLNEDRGRFGAFNFDCATNLLVTHLNDYPTAFYVFDLASRQPLLAVVTEFHHFYRMFDSGEALLFKDNEECQLECKWFLPPKLAEIALRVIHTSMPSATKGLLKKSNVDSIQALVHYLVVS